MVKIEAIIRPEKVSLVVEALERVGCGGFHLLNVTGRGNQKGIEIFDSIPLRYVNVDMENAMVIAGQTNTYAYDAYFLDCALRHSAPLLTLDAYLKQVAGKIGIAILEV